VQKRSKRKNHTQKVEEQIEALKDADPGVRAVAVLKLGLLGDKIAVPYLIKALKDIDPVVREVVCWALGVLGDNSITQKLEQAKKIEKVYLVKNAIQKAIEVIKFKTER